MIRNFYNSFLLLFIGMICITNLAHSATYTVTGLSDSGPGTLRQAILDANANFGADEIEFNLGNGTFLIAISSSLEITDAVHIKGSSLNKITIDAQGNNYGAFIISYGAPTTMTGIKIFRGRTVGTNTDMPKTISNTESGYRYGGGIYTTSNLYLFDCIFQDNKSMYGGNGGAIYTEASELYINNCYFTGNFAADHVTSTEGGNGKGGAIFVQGAVNVTIINSGFNSNTAGTVRAFEYAGGGAIFMSGTGGGGYTAKLDLIGCTFRDNKTDSKYSAGGALKIGANTVVNATNCSFINNRAGGVITMAEESGQGGAFYGDNSSINFNMVNCLSTGNSSNNGNELRGAYIAHPFTVQNSIFTDNWFIIDNTVTSLGFNISKSTHVSNNLRFYLTLTGDRMNTDPLLGTEASNGILNYFPLLCGSPAIDAITISGTTSMDQLGNTRDNLADIGPIEYFLPSITGVAFGSICGTGSVALSATASKGQISWYSSSLSGVALLSNSSTFTSPGISISTTYFAEAKEGNCTSTSRANVLASIVPNTSIVSQPSSISICNGSSATISISATGENITYNWRSGENGITYINTTLAGVYDITVSGTCGSVVSQEAVLTYKTPTSIVTQPSPKTICGGSSALFAVSASGENLSYAWSNNNNSGTLMSTSVAGQYFVTITGSCGNVVSNSFRLANSICGSNSTITSAVILFPTTVPSTFTGTSANISWTTLTGAATYCIRYSKTANFSTTVKTVCGLTSANYLFILSTSGLRLQATEETIYYQVLGVDADGNSSQWSDIQSIILQPNIINSTNQIESQPIFEVYPNPNSGAFIVILSNSAQYEIVSMDGRTINQGILHSGSNELNLRIESGIYFFKSNGKTIKLVLQ